MLIKFISPAQRKNNSTIRSANFNYDNENMLCYSVSKLIFCPRIRQNKKQVCNSTIYFSMLFIYFSNQSKYSCVRAYFTLSEQRQIDIDGEHQNTRMQNNYFPLKINIFYSYFHEFVWFVNIKEFCARFFSVKSFKHCKIFCREMKFINFTEHELIDLV